MENRVHNKKKLKSVRQNLRNEATKAERTLWKHLRGKQMGGYKFRRQHGIGNYVVDFYCPELKLIIELDGWVHGDKEQRKKYVIRQKYLESQEFCVIRYTNAQIKYEMKSVLANIWHFCEERSKHVLPLRKGESEGVDTKKQERR